MTGVLEHIQNQGIVCCGKRQRNDHKAYKRSSISFHEAIELLVRNLPSAQVSLRKFVYSLATVNSVAQASVTVVTAMVAAAKFGGFTKLDVWPGGG
jgi:hypothetical protein